MDRAEGPKSTSATRRHGNILISKIRRPEEGSPLGTLFFFSLFKPKMFTLRLIMRPHRTEPQGKTFCETTNRFPENASRLGRVDGEARPAPCGTGGESRARPRRTLAACAPSTAGARPRLPEPREPPLQKRLLNLFACTAITDILNLSPTGIFFPVVFSIVSPAALHCKDSTISPCGAFPVDAVKVVHSFFPPFKLSADTWKLLVPNACKNSR